MTVQITTTTAPADADLADLCDKAAEIIAKNGLAKRYLYDTKQAETGLPLKDCRVDVIGALNIAAHGTPRYAGSRIVYAAERALEKRIDRVSLVVWIDEKGRTKDDAIDLLTSTAASLRGAAS